MKWLLTGPFGNIGAHVLAELAARGHDLRCFDLPSKENVRAAQRWQRRHPIEVLWGDLRREADVAAAVRGCDAVIHLAFVIPKLSATGVDSETRPEWAREVNVGGMLNLLAALRALQPAPRLLFASSLHVFGPTQHQPPPRQVSDAVHPTEHYALHKVACEEMVKASGLPWAIFRLAASMPIRLILDRGLFDVPLANRIEYVHGKDVARAIANALERPAAWGQTWLIGGGPACQFYYRDLAARVLDAFGVGMLPDHAFSTTPFATDWLDTSESQRVLEFQRHTLADYVADVKRQLGPRRQAIQAVSPLVRAWLLRQSPYARQMAAQPQPAFG
ncbi:MAG: NAD(P)-dependent oxidoreductase [Caldilineales bacterium]|nr:NAD(P)-dependent oxidoreductase [Caldilineales bacterium]